MKLFFLDQYVEMNESVAVTVAARIEPYILATKIAKELWLGINAGHDPDLENLQFLKSKFPFIN